MSRVAAATPYQDWHNLFAEFAGFETVGSDDVLAALLPLMRQTLELHEAGLVAPLDGVEQIGVFRGRVFIGPGKGLAPRDNAAAVARLQGMSGALDFEGGRRPAAAALDEPDPVALSAGRGEQAALGLAGPALVPGYRCWEQLVGHHDALTDVFCLGQLGASLAVGVDLTEPRAVEKLAKHRRRLGRLNPRLHPTLARQLTRMTELDRRDREQDLVGAIERLESYRRLGLRRASETEHERRGNGAEGDAAAEPAATGAPPSGDAAAEPVARRARRPGPAELRSRAILSELRGRLYDLSRRNRLIFHRPASAELDLTEASTPIVMRADAIRPEQIFTLASAPARSLMRGETVPLSDIIRFEDMAHASAALDKLRAEDRKDRADVGVSQLRLIIGFLDWRNLKHEPETPIRSPLLLLPVRLKKRRGVRDSFELSADGAEAEVNPTLRRYLRVLYAVDMPERVDLSDPDAVVGLHEALLGEIARTEPGVSLELRSEPDIRALHRRALRRVDVYKRRSRPTESARRRYGDIGYSYQRDTFRPLGVQLYERFVAPPAPPNAQADLFVAMAPLERAAPSGLPLSAAEQAGQGPLSVSKADGGPPPLAGAPSVSGGGGDPFAWSIDLCALTVSNLNYRRMSLVRDYDALLAGALEANAQDGPSAAFDEIFADRARPIAAAAEPPPVAERRTVVESDPTQEAAIARARDGGSFVIQGPPGAGKSQTIANLVADQVALGRRVLFIAEKRAAIDVVLRRLEAIGLAPLAARVHDSAEDKKAFVQEVRGLFEAWSGPADVFSAASRGDRDAAGDAAQAEEQRDEALGRIDAALARLSALDRDMRASLEGEPTHALLTQAAKSDRSVALDPHDRARAPSLREWREGRDAAREMAGALRRLGAEPILARHPARFVSAEACADPALFERLSGALDALGPHLERIAPAAELAVWDGAAADGGELRAADAETGEQGAAAQEATSAPREAAPLAALFAQIDYAARLRPVAVAGRLKAFDVDSPLASALKRRVDDLALERAELARAGDKTRIWEDKLSDLEAQTALELARRHEGKLFGVFSAPWRQAKAEVSRRCRLDELSIRPSIRSLLEDLVAEQEAAARVGLRLREIGEEMGLEDGEEALRLIEERDNRAPREGVLAAPLLRLCVTDPAAAESRITALSDLKPAADAARAALARCFDGLDALPVERAFSALSDLRAERDQLPGFAPALRALAEAPEPVRAALRRIEAPVETIEQAIVDAAAERALSMRPGLREMSGALIDEARAEIVASLRDFRAANARLALEAARTRFVGHLDLTQRLELELDADGQRLRRRFVDARRDLERELSKSQRFRSIRELLAGPAGLLLRDLKPVWMMSPLSVADVLPLKRGLFDLVIFDEASQVTVEAAAPSLFRAAQAVVVGDEKQMPPSRFFAAAAPGGADAADLQDHAEELAEELAEEFATDFAQDGLAGGMGADALIDPDALSDASRAVAGALSELDADSLLSQACRSLPSVLLGWHYRSRSEELIAFSNAVFYAGKLITIPSIKRRRGAEPIVATSPEQGSEHWREALARSVSFHHTPFGRFKQRRNPSEAEYVAEMVRGFLLAKATKSLGVVAFSEAHAAEIERALERLAKKDAKFRRAYEAELDREIDGAFAGLFIKNLENVQGDERDMIIVSIGYAPDAAGKLRLNFGPVNREGGERRLNVLFTRAREHLALVSSIRAGDLGAVANDGALCLKSYLAYAEAVSRGDGQAAARVLSSAGRDVAGPDARASALAEPIAEGLRARGFVAETALGQSRFTVDLAARRRDDPDWTTAVLLDGPAHYAVGDQLERYALRPQALEAFGWRVATVLSVDWRRDPEGVLDRIAEQLRD